MSTLIMYRGKCAVVGIRLIISICYLLPEYTVLKHGTFTVVKPWNSTSLFFHHHRHHHYSHSHEICRVSSGYNTNLKLGGVYPSSFWST